MKKMVCLLYPESRVVSEETVIGWARDVWEDGRDEGFEPGRDEKPSTLEEAKVILEDLGLVTFAR